jgi:hypothetical protein
MPEVVAPDHAHLPRIDRGDVRLLWHCDFWDVPLDGVCLFRGRRHWFSLWAEGEAEDDGGFYRRYLVLELRKDQLDEEEYWQALFRRKVGTHADYAEQPGLVLPPDAWHEFYEAYRKRAKPDYSANPAAGWFEVR